MRNVTQTLQVHGINSQGSRAYDNAQMPPPNASNAPLSAYSVDAESQQHHAREQANNGDYDNKPQPLTDMKIYVGRSWVASNRLGEIHVDLTRLVARLLGEGVNATEQKATPQPCGLSSEMAESLSATELAIRQIESVVKRLSQFA